MENHSLSAKPNDCKKSVEYLLNEIIDYAGLFPPAELSLEKTLANYLAAINSKHAWMVSKLILPEKLLADFNKLAKEQNILNPIRLSILTAQPVAFLAQHSTLSEFYKIESLEVNLGESNLNFDNIANSCKVADQHNTQFLFEVPYQNNWEKVATTAIDEISRQDSKLLGFKLRCGTTDPVTTPTASQLAWAISETATKNVPIKFTAGLHHPFRKFHPSFDGYMHGFFNVFYATFLAFQLKLPKETLEKLINAEDAAVKIDADNITWLGYTISCNEIKKFRENNALSFGSCSITEPITDLIELGWL